MFRKETQNVMKGWENAGEGGGKGGVEGHALGVA